MIPLAPGRESTTICWPHDSVIFCPRRRASVSDVPPGENGMITRIGLTGYGSAACAGTSVNMTRADTPETFIQSGRIFPAIFVASLAFGGKASFADHPLSGRRITQRRPPNRAREI